MPFIQVTDTQADKRLFNCDHIVQVRADDRETSGSIIVTADGEEHMVKESYRSVKGYILKATGQRGELVKAEGETE